MTNKVKVLIADDLASQNQFWIDEDPWRLAIQRTSHENSKARADLWGGKADPLVLQRQPMHIADQLNDGPVDLRHRPSLLAQNRIRMKNDASSARHSANSTRRRALGDLCDPTKKFDRKAAEDVPCQVPPLLPPRTGWDMIGSPSKCRSQDIGPFFIRQKEAS